jgi:cytochrome c oxidase accessory protein FixG
VFYFGDAPTLFREIFTGAASPTIYFFVGMLTFTTYSLAGTMREQVCTYMCPWPRIQAAMIDEHSLQVTYRAARGEPRGPHKKGASWEGRGDCVDCTQCVAVCPMGIDIRQGLQLECINCGLCVDACDEVMARVDRPRGLIDYYNVIDAAKAPTGEKPRIPFFRPRTILYALLILVLGSVMLWGLFHRPTIGMEIIRDRNPTFVRLADGSIRNGYSVKILNMRGARDVIVKVDAGAHATLKAQGGVIDEDTVIIPAKGDSVTIAHIFVALPPGALSSAPAKIAFVAADPTTATVVRKQSAFLRE